MTDITERLRAACPSARDYTEETYNKLLLSEAADEIERLENINAWDFYALMAMAKRILDERYPADVFTGESGDLGPRFVVALREMIADIEAHKDD